VPISNVISNLLRFGIQFALFLVVYAVYQIFIIPGQIHTNWYALMLPVLVAMLAGLALGFGVLFSSLTTKYRDLQLLLGYFVSLWMYATPVIYPLSTIHNNTLRFIMSLNPLTGIVEAFKYGFLGEGVFSWGLLGYSFAFMVVLLAIGVVLFNRVQRTFMDTV
jgi:lipopolysaccharide transport system permease protein